jgi:hypothetical protein
MNQNPLLYPPQMRNGGLPPAHLPSSSLSNPSAWLQYKWSQPPPRTPDWVFDDFQKFNPLANVGCPFCNKEWLQRALHKDQQAASLLPPKSPGGPILLGAHARAESAYQDWKWAVNELWEHERHCLQTAARQCLLDKRAAHKCQEAARQEAARAAQCLLDKHVANECQEANRCQQLLDEHAAYEHQEAVRRQWLLNKETAHCQRLLDEKAAHRECTALARQMAAARTIFLWLRRHRLQICLAQKTARRQQREATLACLQYKQECCVHAAMADKRQRQAAATWEKALADEVDEQRCQEEAAHAAASADMALAEERRCHEMATIAAMVAEKAIAQLAATLVEMALTAEQHCHEAAMQEKALADKANKQRRAAAWEKALANNANKQR